MKKILIVIIAIAALLIGGIIAVYPSNMRDVEVQGIDLTAVNDGRYIGTFERGRFTNSLAVYVENNRIVRIEVVDDVVMASVTNAAGEVFRRVIEAQATNIDAVAGATVTTNAYLKSIEDALMR